MHFFFISFNIKSIHVKKYFVMFLTFYKTGNDVLKIQKGLFY